MTINEFNHLDEMEQAEAIWEGIFIDNRVENGLVILLYQIDSFYVEVFYHQELNVIRGLRSFTNTNQLEPYLRKINLDGML